jgi:hypothetical protein
MEIKMLTDIKNEIKTIMNSVDDVFNIYTDKKYVKEAGSFIEHYKAENILGEKFYTAWFISRNSSLEEKLSNKENMRNHSISIMGYLGINEANNSYRKFEGIIEDICSVFRGNLNLNNKCLEISPVQVETIQEKSFGLVVCHYTELKINCWEKIQID